MNNRLNIHEGSRAQTRPLHLAPGNGLQVQLDDGVALRIDSPERTRALYPLQRLSRVHSASDVSWTTQALLACLWAGIPVIFHDARGCVRARCVGAWANETSLSDQLRQAVCAPDWPDFWRGWQTGASQREARSVRRCLASSSVRGANVGDLHVSLCNQLRARWGFAPARWVRAMRPALHGLATQVCADHVGDASLVLSPAPSASLAETVAELAICRADMQLLSLHAAEVANSDPGRIAAMVMELGHADIYRACAGILGDLERSLRQWLD